MHYLYNLGIWCYVAAIRLASGFSRKAALWVAGRKHWRHHYREKLSGSDKRTLWMHVASLGEFEQGRAVLEQFRAAYPAWRIVLTFFSPSGYEIRKNYPLADFVAYLPADTPQNARDFLALVQPDLAIFVKYDFWANYLLGLQQRQTPTLLVSGLFRPDQIFFKWYGAFYRKMLGCFHTIHVQNSASEKLLQQVGIESVVVAGDTRIDRVIALANQVAPNAVVAAFTAERGTKRSPVLIAGSAWEQDENLFLPVLDLPEFADFKIIIAPHEPSPQHVQRLQSLAPDLVLYSEFSAEKDVDKRILVIDNVGMLNTLYQYADIAYIGGGFGKGIHNTLEPAAFALPIIFGPQYQKFEEARQFVATGGAFPVEDGQELVVLLHRLQNETYYQAASQAVKQYLLDNEGASRVAMAWVAKHVSG